jgi:aminoglycoside phosphotransferase (APT) family kinase protein
VSGLQTNGPGEPGTRAVDPHSDETLHSEDRVLVEHLRRRGVVGSGAVAVERLSGGVSNDVLAVSGNGTAVVVKRALGRLRVAEEWLADPNRVFAEAAALRAAAAVQADRVPPVLDVDRDDCVIVIGRADPSAREWKTDLMSGVVDPIVPDRLGRVLARWHDTTALDPAVREEFSSTEAFAQLRVDPFYRWVAARHPDLSPAIEAVVRRMADSRVCLVHGDFSPKNILLWPGATWVIDWEVAHYGDPTFDLGFLLAHLVCKSLRRPDCLPLYRDAAETFLEAYRSEIDPQRVPIDEGHLAAQLACLVLARMDGKSPVTYLDDDARARGRAVARAAIVDRPDDIDELWRRLL